MGTVQGVKVVKMLKMTYDFYISEVISDFKYIFNIFLP